MYIFDTYYVSANTILRIPLGAGVTKPVCLRAVNRAFIRENNRLISDCITGSMSQIDMYIFDTYYVSANTILRIPLGAGFSEKYHVSPLSLCAHCFDVVSLGKALNPQMLHLTQVKMSTW